MLFSTYWKCLLTDGDMCWQTFPHFVQKEGGEKGWGGKQNLISNGTKSIAIERKRKITEEEELFIFMLCTLCFNCQSNLRKKWSRLFVYSQVLPIISSCKLCKTTSRLRIFPQEIFFYPMCVILFKHISFTYVLPQSAPLSVFVSQFYFSCKVMQLQLASIWQGFFLSSPALESYIHRANQFKR